MQHVVIRLITPTERASNGGRRWRGPRFPSCCSCRWRPSAAGGQRRRCDTACGCRRLGVGHGRTGSQERDHLGGGRFSVASSDVDLTASLRRGFIFLSPAMPAHPAPAPNTSTNSASPKCRYLTHRVRVQRFATLIVPGALKCPLALRLSDATSALRSSASTSTIECQSLPCQKKGTPARPHLPKLSCRARRPPGALR